MNLHKSVIFNFCFQADEYGMSSYEKMRLKNIEDNAKFFASLEIFKVSGMTHLCLCSLYHKFLRG